MAQLPNISMVIGGAASGKSVFAERLVITAGEPRTYLATAQAFDDEMHAKIERHKSARAGDGWTTIEEPTDLTGALARTDGAVLLDCATLWLTNLMLGSADIDAATDALLDQLAAQQGPVVVVTNELGHGVVPENQMSRRFVQIQGRLNQKLAARAALVVQVTAGLPQVLKGQLPESTT